MRDEEWKELDELLDAYDQKQELPKERRLREQAQEAEFHADYELCCNSTIIPVMKEICDRLEKRKREQKCKVLITPEETHPGGKTTPPQVAIEFYPYGIDRGQYKTRRNTPFVSFVGNAATRRVEVRSGPATPNAPNPPESMEGFSVDEIDRDFVKNKILEVLRAVLSN